MKSRTLLIVVAAICVYLSPDIPVYGKTRGPKPKNVILMISDGCGFNHVDAASLFEYGQTGVQAYEAFPLKLAMSTYAAGQSYVPSLAWDHFNYVSDGNNCTDSAASATAMSTGVKTYNGAIGVDTDERPLKHILEVAEDMGKSTGVITSVPLSHATPAAFVAHNKSRQNCETIAKQMVYESRLEVIMGCGHPGYDDDGLPVNNPGDYKYVGGKDTWQDLSDGRLTGADADGDGVLDDWTVVFERSSFRSLMVGSTPRRVIGIVKKHSTLQQGRGADTKAEPFTVPYNGDVPTLTEMTRAALNILDEDPDGFFLMIEGGAIDWASHKNQAGRMIEEQVEFNKAVGAVLEWVALKSNWRKTLLVVTADHECGYLTGPQSGPSKDGPVWKPLVGRGIGQAPEMEWHSKSHTNALIPFYAKGCGARQFSRSAVNNDPVRGKYIDNTDIGKIILEFFK